MIVAVTGTPGTGKTHIARAAAEILGWPLVDSLELARRAGAVAGSADEVAEIDFERLGAEARKLLPPDAIVEGLAAHACGPDAAVVLRTRPDVLRARLQQRGWPLLKVDENVEAELVDAVLLEALELVARVQEADTTATEPGDIAQDVARLARGQPTTLLRAPGSTDWLEVG